MHNTTIKSTNILFLLMFLSTLGPIAIDVYLPSLPAIASYFSVPISEVQLSISAFTFGYSIGALIHGTLSDKYGRKLIMLYCLILGLIGGIICFCSHTSYYFLIGRLIQGGGFSGTVVLSRTIIRDIATDQIKLIQNASILASLSSIITALSPLMGGFIQEYLYWQMNFIILSGIAFILIIICWFKLPETIQEYNTHTFSSLLRDSCYIIKNQHFLLYNLITTLTLTCLITYQAVSSPILQIQIGLKPNQYGYTAMIMALLLGGGGFTNARAIRKYRRSIMYSIGGALFIISGVIYCLISILKQINLFTMLIPIGIFSFSAGIMFPNSSSGAMSIFASKVGTASSIYTFFQMLGVSVVSGLLLNYFSHSISMLGILFLFAGSLSLFANRLLHYPHPKS